MYSEKGELTSCLVCLVWYVVCRGSYVCREVSRRSLFSSSVQRSWKPVEEPAIPLRKTLGQCGALHFVTSHYYPSIPCHRQQLLLVLQ